MTRSRKTGEDERVSQPAVFLRSVPLFFFRLDQCRDDLLRFAKWHVGLKAVNALLYELLLVTGQVEKFYSRAIFGAELLAPDEDPAYMPTDPVVEPDKARLEMGIRFDPDPLCAEVDELGVMGFPFKMFECYNAQATVPIADDRLSLCFSRRFHRFPLFIKLFLNRARRSGCQ